MKELKKWSVDFCEIRYVGVLTKSQSSFVKSCTTLMHTLCEYLHVILSVSKARIDRYYRSKNCFEQKLWRKESTLCPGHMIDLASVHTYKQHKNSSFLFQFIHFCLLICLWMCNLLLTVHL
jgi:hypothetical protein